MTPSDLDRLIQDHLDGRATTEESDRLRQELEKSAETRAQYRQLEKVFAALHALEPSEPPEGLLDTVRPMMAAQQARRSTGRAGFGSRLGLGLTFAAGLVVGGLVFFALERVSLDGTSAQSPLVGTVAPEGELDRKRIVLDQGEILLQSRRSGDEVTITIETRATVGPVLVLEYDSLSLAVAEFHRGEQEGGVPDQVSFDGGRLELRPATSGRYALRLRGPRTAAPLQVAVHDGSRVVRDRLVVGSGKSSQDSPPGSR